MALLKAGCPRGYTAHEAHKRQHLQWFVVVGIGSVKVGCPRGYTAHEMHRGQRSGLCGSWCQLIGVLCGTLHHMWRAMACEGRQRHAIHKAHKGQRSGLCGSWCWLIGVLCGTRHHMWWRVMVCEACC